MRQARRAERILLAAALVVGPSAAWTAVTASAAYADATPSFDGFASGYGVRPTVYNESLPLGLTIEGSGPVAQAHLSSLGNSDALASFPYPGDTVAGLPGTAGALFGAPIPQYPMYVATGSGDDPKSQDAPGVQLSAASFPTVAIGSGVVGSDGSGSTSNARVALNADNSVTAAANAVSGLNLLNGVSLSGVESSATVTADGSTGKLRRSSHLSITEIKVPALHITIPPTTPGSVPIPVPVPGVGQLPPVNLPEIPLPFGGETLPLTDIGFVDGVFTATMPKPGSKPVTYALPARPVLDAFKQLGIIVTFEAAQNSTTGVIAPALTFTYTAAALPPNNYYSGPTDIGFTVGRSIASVTLHPITSDFGSGGGLGGPVGGIGGGSDNGGGITPGLGLTTGSSGSTAPPAPGTGAVSSPPVLAGPPSSAGSSSTGGALGGLLASVQLDQVDLRLLYLVATAVALALAATSWVLRTLGVKLLWAS